MGKDKRNTDKELVKRHYENEEKKQTDEEKQRANRDNN